MRPKKYLHFLLLLVPSLPLSTHIVVGKYLEQVCKETCQKILKGFFPLGGGYPPFPLSFFEHNVCPLRGGGLPPNSGKEKIR